MRGSEREVGAEEGEREGESNILRALNAERRLEEFNIHKSH